MTLAEYQLRMEAYGLHRVEADRRAMMEAFFAQVAKSTTGSSENPQPKYKTFTDLFDEQAEIDRVRSAYESDYKPVSKASQEQNVSEIIRKRVEQFHKLKKEGKLPTKLKQKGGENNGR